MIIKAQLTWQGNHLCQACGARLDKRTPDLIELLDVKPRPMFFIPICPQCANEGDLEPDHLPIAASFPPAGAGTNAKYRR